MTDTNLLKIFAHWLGAALIVSIVAAAVLAWRFDGESSQQFYQFLQTVAEFVGAALGITSATHSMIRGYAAVRANIAPVVVPPAAPAD